MQTSEVELTVNEKIIYLFYFIYFIKNNLGFFFFFVNKNVYIDYRLFC